MRTIRIELIGDAGRATIHRLPDKRVTRIESIINAPKLGQKEKMSWDLPFEPSVAMLFKIADQLRYRCDGPGTIAATTADVGYYITALQRYAY